MTTHSPPRRIAAILALAVAAGSLLLPTAATAAEGAAPQPTEYRVLAGVHTDMVSTFLDDGQLTLGTTADVPEGPGTRFDAQDVWFHLENEAQQSVPAGYEFIAAEGSTVWLASEANPGADRLWPGFNTASVARGAVENDTTQFTLTAFEGPGELEVYTGGGNETLKRLWSSRDAGIRSFDIGRTHMHANWAFTAAGTYRLGVDSTATVKGTAQTASATYTVIVGDLDGPTKTATALSASRTTLVSGDPVSLSAGITPSDVRGFVEFRDGATVLGHEPVSNGAATFTAAALAIGTHSFTAVYVPAVANVSAASTSLPLPVTVTDGSGVEFGVAGIESLYAPGETLSARVVGHTPSSGQTYRWVWRQIGTDYAYVLRGGGEEAQGRLTLPVDMSHNDYEVSVQVRQGNTSVAQSSWVPIAVRSEVQPLTPTFPDGEMYLGDEIFVELDGALADGDTIQVAQRGTAGPWFGFSEYVQTDADTLNLKPTWQSTGVSWAIQTVRDGVVVAQSDPVAKDVVLREVHVEGLQGVYRVGQTLRATARVYPEIEGLIHTWSLQRSLPEAPYFEERIITQGSAESDLSVEMPIELEHQGWSLSFVPSLPEGHASGATQVGTFTQVLNVSDSSPDTQLLFFQALGEHYHQGYDVNLDLMADPALADGDTITWQWRWPETEEWATLPGASGMNHTLVAEQAMHGVEVRAVLEFADGADELIADPVTIRVDDHGSPARQNVTISGARVSGDTLTAAEGESVTVSSDVAHGTVLDSFQWFLASPGEAEAVPIPGANAATFEFVATSQHDGAELTVAVVKPGGALAYGPSAPVSMAVSAATTPPEQTRPDAAPQDQRPEILEDVPAGVITLGSLTVAPGDRLTVELGGGQAGAWVAAWLFSTPTLLGGDWVQADGAGSIEVRIPLDAVPGEHRLAVLDSAGSLLGWANLVVTHSSDPSAVAGAPPATADAPPATGSALAVTGGTVPLALVIAAMLLIPSGALLARTRRRAGSTV